MRVPARSALVLTGATLLAAAAGTFLAQDAERRRGFSVELTEPVNQDIVLGRSRIAAEVEIDSAQDLDRVEFLVGDDVIFVDRQPPFECVHDFGEESKAWVVRAVAYHVEGVTVSDVVITRKINLGYVEEVNRVILWATVTDGDDNLVTDLTRDQFKIREGGVEQEILEFHPEDRALTLAILLDSSSSMREQLDELHAAAAAFVDTLRPEDRALVIDFDDKVFLTQDLTADHDRLKEAITTTQALGNTAIYDALHSAFRTIRDIQGHRAIVLLSDGDDTASQFGFERVLEEAKAQNVIIYAIGLGGGDRRVLEQFPGVTGGRPFFVKKADELKGVYERIMLELRHQYFLTYSTTNKVWDGRWIDVKVECTNPKLEVRARRGFFAVRASTHGTPGG